MNKKWPKHLCVAVDPDPLETGRMSVHETKADAIDFYHAGCGTYTESYTRTCDYDEAVALVQLLVKAMSTWGAEEDGVPSDGLIGLAYDKAKEFLKKEFPKKRST